ncbi:hypothetical protein [uncultured Thiodictyon sp.]|nr:hypothetical protein [uncultured Thiodictyon sp.]
MASIAPDGGAEHLERLLAILRRLDAAGRLYPAQRAAILQCEEHLRRAR